MFKTLVVALDLEADGDRALPVVKALAGAGKVDVDLITVSEPGMSCAVDAYELEQRAKEYGWSCDAWSVVHDTDVARGILQHAARRREALVVMATTARRPYSPVSSVTQDVLRAADRPVLLVGPHVPWTYAPTSTTLVPCLDSSEPAERAIPTILDWQHTFACAPPQIVEVVPEFDDEVAARRRVDAFAELLAAQHVHGDTHLVFNDDPIAGLERMSDQFTGVVYVTTSARYTGGRLHWHSTTQALVHRGNRPVLVVPARPATLTSRVATSTDEHVAFRDLTLAAPVLTVAQETDR